MIVQEVGCTEKGRLVWTFLERCLEGYHPLDELVTCEIILTINLIG